MRDTIMKSKLPTYQYVLWVCIQEAAQQPSVGPAPGCAAVHDLRTNTRHACKARCSTGSCTTLRPVFSTIYLMVFLSPPSAKTRENEVHTLKYLLHA